MPNVDVRLDDTKGLALVVDDQKVNRIVLEALLKAEGYQTVAAEDGSQAVEIFAGHNPDIVFMDAMMPGMNGYEAATRIKELAGTNFVPIIFLTSMREEDALVKCVEAGGDEFLNKPFRREIFVAKIKAMERIRDLSRKVARQHEKIQSQHQLMLSEQIIAEQIYSRAVTEANVNSKYIFSTLKSVSIFSGDLLLTGKCPDGKLHVLLGDFTGHGLIAAVGVLPTAEVFRAMTSKGFSAVDILAAINSKLNRLLPTGMFMAACFVVIDAYLKNVSIWNAGMPEALVLGSTDGNKTVPKHRVTSRYLPLGILSDFDENLVPENFSIANGDRILICSDGLSEATNAIGTEFGLARYEQAVTSSSQSFVSVVSALGNFCGTQPYNDDVSLVEIQCVPELLENT